MKKREDKGILTEPRCSFCNQLFEKPHDIKTEVGEFLGGVCECGAIYACDPTGHNLGEAFVDALSYACNEDWEMALNLDPEKDYTQETLNYDIKTHTIKPEKGLTHYRASYNKLLFIKLREGILNSKII